MKEKVEMVKLTLEELDSFINTNEFEDLADIPLTPYRATSYMNNPRAHPDDIVLYTLFHHGQLLSYRSILSDKLFTNGQHLRVGWFSGNWTHPNHRRKGYSSLLLKEVRKDWGDRLLFSNYAPASKDVLDQTKAFALFKVLNGQRYYFKFGFGDLLPPKSIFFEKTKPLLSGIDHFLNRFISNKQFSAQIDGRWEKLSSLADEDMEFIQRFKPAELFRRGKEEYEWILQYPWMQTSEEAKKWDERYHFSCYAEHFDLSFYRLKIRDQHEGILLISIRDQILNVHYAYLNDSAISLTCQLLFQLASKENVLHLTVFHKGLIQELNKSRRFYLFRKKFQQAFLCSNQLLTQFPEIRDMDIQKGDGDAVFT